MEKKTKYLYFIHSKATQIKEAWTDILLVWLDRYTEL
jgi:hypothetical protein